MPPKKRTKGTKAARTAKTLPSTPTPVPSKRRVVKIADDADDVLAKCRALRQELILKSETEKQQAIDDVNASSIDIDANDNDILPQEPHVKVENGKTTASIASLRGKSIVEVSEMSSMEVVEAIEAEAVRITKQVLQKKGFSLEVPSRSAANQIYVPELDRIVLGTKRGTRSFLNVKVSAIIFDHYSLLVVILL